MAPTIPIDYKGRIESEKFSKASMMGKSRKVSKGYSTGFVPDYRHAVETVGESEGFGSSGRVDMELIGSEDSCVPKRKSVSMNADGFGGPMHVLSFSGLSRMEKRELKMRLRDELERVRMLQRKISSLSSNSMVISPNSDIHSYSYGAKRQGAVDTFPNKVTASSGKHKSHPLGHVPRTKGEPAVARRPESTKHAAQNPNDVMLMKQCEALLNRLMTQQHSWIFNNPVDPVALNIPDYFNIIKHPMDLGTVKKKLLSNKYSSVMEFASDVRLTFNNAKTYNPAGNHVHIIADSLSKFFEVRWKSIEKKIPVKTDEFVPAKSSFVAEAQTPAPVSPTKRLKTFSVESKVKQEPVRQVMSAAEKTKLGAELEALMEELPDSIIDFLRESSIGGDQVSEDEIEIDIDTLSNDALFKLRNLLDDHLLEKQKSQARMEPCEIEICNESGFSNSSSQPCKGDEPAHEDVDIGGNDPPISSFPPLEIDKDTARRNSKCNSSSSESGSSSDSDLENSSASESNIPKDSVAARTAKEPAVSSFEQKNNDIGDPNTGDPSIGHPEQNEQVRSASVEPKSIKEEESTPPERQVSPEKLYRAALLRSRFADIIIKAQENTTEKDPEKLKLEREELEKRRREEKARLQAEAKAAEEARRKAEAEAAAEAKRKREQEREAARRALQQMEKTVDINENSQFMEDLEMFKVAPDENLQNFIEASPDHSQDGLGSFKFPATSNPLEQLGLYMKNEDEEEEEDYVVVKPPSTMDTSNDPEEGEID